MKTLLKLVLAFWLGGVAIAQASETLLKPFILTYRGAGTVAEKTTGAEAGLTANGFVIVGRYSPYSGAMILAVTSDDLKTNAAASPMGGFGVVQRVAITQVNREVQVSYTNPVYMANAYRMADDLHTVAARLEAALGAGEPFGAKGLTAEALRKYHYMFGMEYFTDPSELATYPSHEAALAAVEKGLANNRVGVSRVYRVDVPGGKESLFGVGMKASDEDHKYMDDRFIMSEIDFRDIKSTAHLPYEILISGDKAYALYARFRIAIDFPDLAMVGSNSFVNIMKTPNAIEAALRQAISP